MIRFRSNGLLFPILVLVAGAFATGIVWTIVNGQIQDAEQIRFTRYSNEVVTTIKERLRDHERLLDSGRGLFYASKSVEFDEWTQFANALRLGLYPGILGVGYIAYVPREKLPEYLASVRQQMPSFEVKTKGDHPDLFIIQQIEPVALNRLAWGFDIGQEANRREAAERAALTGMVALTKRITLVQDEKKVAGFLMLLPIYQTKNLPVDAAERKRALSGWVYVPIRIDELMAGIVESTDKMIDFEVLDGRSTSKQDLLYDADGHLANTQGSNIGEQHFRSRQFHRQAEIEVEGRTWTVFISSRKEFEASAAQAHWVSLVGVMLTLLTTFAVWSLLHSRRKAESLADAMTLEVREREHRLRAILDSTADSIVVIDDEGRIQSVNQATEKMFGFTAKEMLGNNVSSLMPEPYRSAHSGYLKRYRDTGEMRVIGKVLALTGQRKDGSTFPIELVITRMEGKNAPLFTGIIRDISEREKMDQMKHEFVSTVSHELRTPLTSIVGALGLVVGGAMGEVSGQVRQLVAIAHSNSERLVRLINDILDIEKVESGKIAVSLRRQSVIALIGQALESNRSYADQYGVRFELAQRPTEAIVNVDADRFLQVMANLLSNAAKFSVLGGVVDVTVVSKAGRVRVSVVDHGTGIPEAFHDKIFHKFTQADSSDTRKKGGTGLGLAICKALVECMHGRIDYHSVPGQGATFYFELPECAAADPLTALEVSRVDSPITPSRFADGKPRILHVEDDPDVRHIVGTLAANLAEFDFAPDLSTAREFLRTRRYDVLILDLALPDGDGWALLPILKKLQPGILVLAFSARELSGQESARVSAALVKSQTSNQTLLHTLSSLISRSRVA